MSCCRCFDAIKCRSFQQQHKWCDRSQSRRLPDIKKSTLWRIIFWYCGWRLGLLDFKPERNFYYQGWSKGFFYPFTLFTTLGFLSLYNFFSSKLLVPDFGDISDLLAKRCITQPCWHTALIMKAISQVMVYYMWYDMGVTWIQSFFIYGARWVNTSCTWYSSLNGFRFNSSMILGLQHFFRA